MTVQRCKISDESIRHALPMGERINIFSAWTVDLSACTVLPVSTFAPKRVMDVEWGFMFFWERAFRGLRHPWLGKEMDCFADFPLFHCFNSESQHSYLPRRFWIAHRRGMRIMAKYCAMFEEPPAPD